MMEKGSVRASLKVCGDRFCVNMDFELGQQSTGVSSLSENAIA